MEIGYRKSSKGRSFCIKYQVKGGEAEVKQEVVGNTPMIKIRYKYKEKAKYLYAKLEYYNITGSIKDRMATYILTKAMERGELTKGQPIVEATSGNTGIALAALGSRLQHPVYIFMPDWVSIERVKMMESYQAKVTLFSKEQGGFRRCIKEAKRFAEKNKGFLANQFSNPDNILAHYETTGVEIIQQVPEKVGGFISGVGTGGTLMGVGRRLKKQDKDTLIVAMEPDKMPLLSKNKIIGQHKIEGIGDDFIPELVDKNLIDKVIVVNDEDAINMARLLARKLGIGVGISSGANFLASVILNDKIEYPVVTVFADDNKKYLSTSLTQDVDNNEKYISNHVQLISWENE